MVRKRRGGLRFTHRKKHKGDREKEQEKIHENKVAQLKNLYFSPKSPVAYSSLARLYKYLQKTKPGQYDYKFIKSWLETLDEYTMHLRFKKPKHFANVHTHKAGFAIDLDVAFFRKLASTKSKGKSSVEIEPDKFLIATDLFSRFAQAVPLKTLKASEVVEATKKILEAFPKLNQARVDRGQEFTSKLFKDYLQSQNINLIYTNPPHKSNYVERTILSIKNLLRRHMRHEGYDNFNKSLNSALEIYNNRGHSALNNFTPP